MRRLLANLIFVASALVLAAPLAAQYTIKNIVFLNPGSYPQADLQTLSALAPGQALSKAGLSEAAARLQGTGYFTDVQATVEGPIQAVEVRIRVIPVTSSLLLPVSFKNFVWLTPEELAALRASVPLLALGVPEAGTAQALVQTALEQAFAAKSVRATLSYAVVEPTSTNPHRTVLYQVDQPAVRLATAHLAGATADMAPALRTALARAQREFYNEASAGLTTADIILAPYFDAGDLEATLAISKRTPLAPAGPNAPIGVEMTARVTPGQPYRVSTLTYTPTAVVPAELFAKTQILQPGALAARKDLMASIQPVLVAYRAKGYMDVYVDPQPLLDVSTHTVAYTLTTQPGEVYRLKSLDVKGLPPAARADFDKTFLLHVGDPYDAAYVPPFFKNNSAVKSLQPFSASFVASADPNTHLVELSIEFFPTGTTVSAH